MSKPNVAILGTGYVGLVAAAVFADRGFSVLTSSHDMNKVEAINNDVWTISGRDVLTNDRTIFLGKPGVGDKVSVIGTEMEDGTLLAKVIYRLFSVPDVETPARFSGFIMEITENAGSPSLWLVQSSVEVNGESVMLDIWISDETVVNADVEVAVGAFVKGVGAEREDGSIDALKVTVTEPPQVPFAGAITERPDEGMIGTWIIGGVTVQVTLDTEIVGDFEEGTSYARGYGLLQAGGSVEAMLLGAKP